MPFSSQHFVFKHSFLFLCSHHIEKSKWLHDIPWCWWNKHCPAVRFWGCFRVFQQRHWTQSSMLCSSPLGAVTPATLGWSVHVPVVLRLCHHITPSPGLTLGSGDLCSVLSPVLVRATGTPTYLPTSIACTPPTHTHTKYVHVNFSWVMHVPHYWTEEGLGTEST